MKRMKRMISALLTLILVLTMALPALADAFDINVKTTQQGHIYTAYQIFKGDVAKIEGKGNVLSNVVWGDDITDGDALIAALQADKRFVKDGVNLFAGKKTARDVAEVLQNFSNDDAFAIAFADVVGDKFIKADAKGIKGKYTEDPSTTTEPDGTVKDVAGKYTIEGLEAGYYLVKDTLEDGTPSTDSMSRYILEVTGDTEVTTKVEKPDIDKEVYNANPQGPGAGDIEKDDTNTAGIGQHVTYEITGTVPNYTGYDYYFYIIEDKLSKGLSFDNNVSIKVGDRVLKEGTITGETVSEDGDYFVYTETDAETGETTVRIAFKDIMSFTTGEPIVVNYSALVTDDAVIGTTGNVNDAKLQYSNDPKINYTGEKDEKTPGLPKEDGSNVLGESGHHRTVTYVAQLEVFKTQNGNKTPLKGAKFKLEGTSSQVVWGTYDKYTEAADGTWYKLKAKDADGNATYTEEAPTKDAYILSGTGTEDTTEGYLYNEETGEYYVPDDKSEYNGKQLYELRKGTIDQYEDIGEDGNVTKKYKKETVTEAHKTNVPVSVELETPENGIIVFPGLGEGTYTLTETVTPEGFNTAEPLEFTITVKYPDQIVTGEEEVEWSVTGKDATLVTWQKLGEEGEDGNKTAIFGFYTNVINNSGTVLPTTGGIGTTILYIIGGILVLGAAVLMVTKKRMSNQKQ